MPDGSCFNHEMEIQIVSGFSVNIIKRAPEILSQVETLNMYLLKGVK